MYSSSRRCRNAERVATSPDQAGERSAKRGGDERNHDGVGDGAEAAVDVSSGRKLSSDSIDQNDTNGDRNGTKARSTTAPSGSTTRKMR